MEAVKMLDAEKLVLVHITMPRKATVPRRGVSSHTPYLNEQGRASKAAVPLLTLITHTKLSCVPS